MGIFGSLFGGSSKPEDLGEVYMDAKQAGVNESMYEVENIMYEEHGLVFDGGMWKPCDHEEPKESLWSKLFG